ncbi:MAG TPA: hypothetical protein GXZ28_00520 [Clostridiales bacterium]|nr:hypothetical protein [Clostridiales bacterium]
MRRQSHIQISSLIAFLSILTILIQFICYYFFASFLLIIGLSSLTTILCCHILLEKSLTYESCFNYSILNLFVSIIITLLSFYGKENSFIPYTNTLWTIVAINWLIPNLHCFLRSMLEYGTRIENFIKYYRNSSAIFIICYLILLIYGNFFKGSFPWAFQVSFETANFTPLLSISILIEDFLYGDISLKEIIVYLCSRILIFIPFGFYISIPLRKKAKILRTIILLLLPALIEFLQYFIYIERCDLDDVLYAFIGGLLGSLLFLLTNLIYRSFSGRDFLIKEKGYGFSTRSLYF